MLLLHSNEPFDGFSYYPDSFLRAPETAVSFPDFASEPMRRLIKRLFGHILEIDEYQRNPFVIPSVLDFIIEPRPEKYRISS